MMIRSPVVNWCADTRIAATPSFPCLPLIPLRQRKVDIPLLVQDFIHRHPVAASKGITSVSKQVMRLLIDYPWLGNIRELQKRARASHCADHGTDNRSSGSP